MCLMLAPPASAAVKRDPCFPLTFKTTSLKGRPAPALWSILGALRRPALATDRIPRRRQFAFSSASSGIYGPGRSVNVRYIRQVGQLPNGDHIFIVPGYSPRTPPPPHRCLRHLTALQRARFLRQLARTSHQPDVEIIDMGDDGNHWSGHSVTARAIATGDALDIVPSAFSPNTRIQGLVPDGVARLTVSGPRSTAADAGVVDNFFAAALPTALTASDKLTVTWLAADATAIKTIAYPRPPDESGDGSFSSGESGFSSGSSG
jgi:hypothetical protein